MLSPEAVFSHGVSSEIRYASSNKDVYIVTPLEKDPFTEYDITGKFKSIEELFAHLEKQ
jgi:hypothetical protein